MKGVSMTKRIAIALSLLLMLATGCKDEPARPATDAGVDTGVDANITDGSVGDGDVMDAMTSDAQMDADVDGSTSDSGLDDAGANDAGLDDAGLDAGVDAGSGDAGPRTPVCDPGTACSTSAPCADGEACIVNACGLSVCQPRAAYCGSNAECASGSSCVTTSIGDLCTPTNGEACNASTDCPPSHVCEGATGARSCVLRRIPCFDEFDCPVSYMCLGVQGDSPTCQYVYRPCDAPGTCPLGACTDIEGNGALECGAGGACDNNAQCTAPERCMNLHFIVECGLGGLCNQSGGDACASGWECRDLQGDGYGECVPVGGSCTSHADCSNGGICAVPLDRSPAHCTYPL